MFNQILTEKIERGDFSLHNRLHKFVPRQPEHHDFTLTTVFHPLENTRHAKRGSDYEPEGRKFDSCRAHHFSQLKVPISLALKFPTTILIRRARIRYRGSVQELLYCAHRFGLQQKITTRDMQK